MRRVALNTENGVKQFKQFKQLKQLKQLKQFKLAIYRSNATCPPTSVVRTRPGSS